MFRVLVDRVVVKPIEEATTSKGGIIIPDTAQAVATRGEVMLTGPDATDVETGQEVIFVKGAGHLVKMGEDEVRVLRQEDIFGIVEG